MGSGIWSPTTYHSRVADLARAGKDAFDYSVGSHRTGVLRVHQTLDPNGLTFRESRDSAEHPASSALAVAPEENGNADAFQASIGVHLCSSAVNY